VYYNNAMKTVQARLDADTEKKLAQLVEKMGISPSMVVRKGIQLLAASQPATRKIYGLGKFASGIGDLSTNKRHMRDFGR
jgi:hypothetical protein